jgi:cytochrome c-type biogenesis protein CcmH
VVTELSALVLLWVFIALLTGAAMIAVLAPLGRRPVRADASERAQRVYLDQLAELDRDVAEGRISAAEAGAARAETARRLIAAAGDAQPEPVADNPRLRRTIAIAALVGIPLLSLTLYLGLGVPALPGRPLAARLSEPPARDDVVMLIARAEEHLARNPEDGRGWEAIAPVYMLLGRPADAATAYRNAIRLLGSNTARQSALGEAILTVQDGVVTAEARSAFEAANAADPAAPAPRFFLALAAEQEGNLEAAADGWRALLAEAAADAPWRAAVEEALARVSTAVPSPGPPAAEIAAGEAMTANEQAEMIEAMVGGLAERLKREPDDADGWIRLIRSYVVLGRADEAAAAARAALAGVTRSEDRGRVEAVIADLGLAPEAVPQ